MPIPALTLVEQCNVDHGPWFSKLTPPLRQNILERARVRRLADGEPAATRGAKAEERCAVASGAVRIGSVSLLGSSRQRVNQDLEALEREGALRVDTSRLIIVSLERLLALSDPSS
jgi:hypothetical protein